MTSPHHNDNMLAALRKVESGSYEGNYTAKNPTSTASGAYQYVNKTWIAQGGGKYAPTARQATPDQQDEIAYADVQRAISAAGRPNTIRGLTDAIGRHWHGPDLPGVHPTVAEYQQMLYTSYQGVAGGYAPNEGGVQSADPLPDLGNPLGGIEAIGAFFAKLLEWSTWLRVLQLLGGLFLIGAGLSILARDTIAPIAKAAAVA